MNTIDMLEREQMRIDIPQFRAGDTVKVHVKISEGEKDRIQTFQGIVIGRHNNGLKSSFTVRKVSSGIGVERVFPLHSPVIDKIEMIQPGKVRRSRLYYLRNLRGKAARVKSRSTYAN
jgi:large subunit ribosomal protein L19